jgi:NTE family protein
MEEHWAAGFRDERKTLAHPGVLTLPSAAHFMAVYDFTNG